MTLHSETFNYLNPTDDQKQQMFDLRIRAQHYASALELMLPDGPDKTYILRKFREVAMWVNVTITRNPDGSPRQPGFNDVKDYPSDHPVEGDLGSIPL